MEKPTIQDIKPNVRNGSRNSSPRNFVVSKAKTLPKEIPFTPSEPKQTSRNTLWIIAIIAIIALVWSLSFLFESATVTITPKILPIALDATDTFTAVKDSSDPTQLSYMIMSLSGDTSITLPATQTETVNNYAKGIVTFYNNYSTTPFKIVKNTQIKGDNGQIYKVDKQIYIPGYTKTGTTTTPGQFDVSVTAATSGEIANIKSSSFTIPYFAKRPQNGKVYAQSKTAIMGGLTGTLNTIPLDSANAAYQTLQDNLKKQLIQKEKVQVPPGYLFYDGATVFTSDNSVDVPYSKDTKIPLGLHGKLTAYLIKEDSLVNIIANKFINNYNNDSVVIQKLASLEFDPTGTIPLNPDTDTTINFSLTGTTKIIWQIDTNNVKNSLLGVSKSNFNNIMNNIVGVDRADMEIKPFWKQSFPTDLKKINVLVNYPIN